ncbi:hypothetical protein L798_07080 [Zootermopsis nevadensis]|uniref:Uncharacterized protein n=1 Tax=Zootermopsis nevadensis TaxID=136037 RepID=A0A067R6B9_ZOONE|nr:hypothetical protein L798_07080 [Zootermopsis nevadensis]
MYCVERNTAHDVSQRLVIAEARFHTPKTKWHWDGLLFEAFGFTVSIIQPLLRIHSYISFWGGQRGRCRFGSTETHTRPSAAIKIIHFVKVQFSQKLRGISTAKTLKLVTIQTEIKGMLCIRGI